MSRQQVGDEGSSSRTSAGWVPGRPHRRRPLGGGGARGAEAAEAVGRLDLDRVGKLRRQPANRAPLGSRQPHRLLGSEQIGAAGGAVQPRTPGEDGHRQAGRGLDEDVGEVVLGVAGSVDHPDPHGPCLDDVSVLQADTRLCVVDILRGREPVARPVSRARSRPPLTSSLCTCVSRTQVIRVPAGRPGRDIDRCPAGDRRRRRPRRRSRCSSGCRGQRLQGHHRDRGGASQMSASRRKADSPGSAAAACGTSAPVSRVASAAAWSRISRTAVVSHSVPRRRGPIDHRWGERDRSRRRPRPRRRRLAPARTVPAEPSPTRRGCRGADHRHRQALLGSRCS